MRVCVYTLGSCMPCGFECRSEAAEYGPVLEDAALDCIGVVSGAGYGSFWAWFSGVGVARTG